MEGSKATFKTKPIKLTIEVEDDETAFLLNNPVHKEMLLKSIAEDKSGQTIAVNITD